MPVAQTFVDVEDAAEHSGEIKCTQILGARSLRDP